MVCPPSKLRSTVTSEHHCPHDGRAVYGDSKHDPVLVHVQSGMVLWLLVVAAGIAGVSTALELSVSESIMAAGPHGLNVSTEESLRLFETAAVVNNSLGNQANC